MVYLVEKHPTYFGPLQAHFEQQAKAGFAISPLVVLECLVGPLKRGDEALQRRFERFFSIMRKLSLEEVDYREAAKKTRAVRAEDA